MTTISIYFGDLPDPRVDRCKHHKLLDIVTIAILLSLTYYDSTSVLFIMKGNTMPSQRSQQQPQPEDGPDQETQQFARYLAVVVHNEMEDFRSKNLSDEQMAELDAIIRNAICTALYAHETGQESSASRKYTINNMRMAPDDWELPRLSQRYLDLVARVQREQGEA